MRLLRYDLIAFGPFTDLSLELAAPGVHLVVGPNEAGKSTARHALGQLLYGIDERTSYDFVHAKRDLRLGALIQRADGGRLEIVRRKARKTPLTDPDGRPIDQAVLADVLGGIDRQTFTTEFALSSAELREGGDCLVAGGGELGQALAASRSGLRLTRVQEAVKARMDELYKPRGSTKPTINVKLRELKEVNGRKRRESLRPDDYLSREREVEEARQELDRLTRELADLRGTHLRLERFDQALPQLTRRRRLLEEIERIRTEGVLAPPEVADRFPRLAEELREAERAVERADARIEAIDRNLAGWDVDEALLEHADDIEALAQELKAAQEAADLLERSAGAAADLRARAADLLAQVHPDATITDEQRYRIPQAVRERAQKLSRERTALDTHLDDSRQARDSRRRKLEQAQRRLAALPPVPDDEPLRSALAAVPADLPARLTTAWENARKHRKRAAAIRAKLHLPPEGTCQVPSRDEVDSHRRTTERLDGEYQNLTERIEELTGHLAGQRLALDALLAHDPPPTREELAKARADRDELWADLPERAEQYLRAVRHADEIADRMLREAERVERVREMTAAIDRDDRKLARYRARRDELASRRDDLEATWRRLWEHYAGTVPAPEAAAATLEQVHRLQETLQEADDAEAAVEALTEQAVQHTARLRELLGRPAGPAPQNALAELLELRELGQSRLAEWQAAAGDQAAARDRVAAEQRELAEAEAQVAQGEQRLADWTARWRHLLEEAGLPPDREPVGALADLDRLGRVAGDLAEADRIERESEQAERQVALFHDELARIADLCGRPVPAEPAERHRLVRRLHADAKDTGAQAAERDRLHRERDEHRDERDDATRAVSRLRDELADLMRRTGVGTAEELDASVRRRVRHTELTDRLAEVTETIVVGSQSLEDLMAEAARTDPDQLKAELAELSARIGDLEARRTRQQELFTATKAELDRLDGSAAAAQAAAEAETLSAALIEETEEYLRLEIARTILLDCAESYRSAQQDPVLERAGNLFGELTLGRFSGLELDQEGDTPVIVARHGTRGPLHVHQLSEGTADQLYLALRLASLERYAAEDRALPFVVDDIFMTFDDARTQAALKVLDAMADRFQMIVFTHHDHLTDLARRALPSGRVHVHRLPEFHPVG